MIFLSEQESLNSVDTRQSKPRPLNLLRETNFEFNKHQERWRVRMEAFGRENILSGEDNGD